MKNQKNRLEEKYPDFYREYAEATKDEIKKKQSSILFSATILLFVFVCILFFKEPVAILIALLLTLVCFVLIYLIVNLLPLKNITKKQIQKYCQKRNVWGPNGLEYLLKLLESNKDSVKKEQEYIERTKNEIKTKIEALKTPEGQKIALKKLRESLENTNFDDSEEKIAETESCIKFQENLISFLKDLYNE